MIPFRTTAPCHGSPTVTMTIIVVNIGVFFFQQGLNEYAATRFIYTHALVPAIYSHPALARQAGLDPSNLLPLVSNSFLHGGYLHLIVNMWTLWLFGLPVEDRLGHWRYVLFYLACGAAASVAHLIFNWGSTVPALGASGAIAGVLGAFTWLFPRAKVAVVVPIIVVPLIVHWPAVLFTALWFALQLVQGWATLASNPLAGGVAWWMHIGGFAAGFLIAVRIRPRAQPMHRPWR